MVDLLGTDALGRVGLRAARDDEIQYPSCPSAMCIIPRWGCALLSGRSICSEPQDNEPCGEQ